MKKKYKFMLLITILINLSVIGLAQESPSWDFSGWLQWGEWSEYHECGPAPYLYVEVWWWSSKVSIYIYFYDYYYDFVKRLLFTGGADAAFIDFDGKIVQYLRIWYHPYQSDYGEIYYEGYAEFKTEWWFNKR